MKRLLDCTASDFESMNGQELKQSIDHQKEERLFPR